MVAGIKPFFEIGLGSAEGAAMPFEAGIEVTAIDHVTTTVKYATSNLSGTGDDSDSGAVIASVKISY